MAEFLARLGMSNPIMLAPMGGGPATPALVAAVSEAGGLGTLAAPYLTPAQIAEEVARIRAVTQRPFAINLFSGAWDAKASGDAAAMLEIMGQAHAELGLPAPLLPRLAEDPFPAQLDAVIAAQPALFTFTFGIPDPRDLARLRAAGILVGGTATTLEEARRIRDAGCDAVVAQGAEAAAHRGTFLHDFEQALVPLAELVTAIRAEMDLPIIAAGGLMDGRDIAEILARGATAAALGTAFLVTPESGAPAAYKQALLGARGEDTELTRAFSGRPARGLRNGFMARLAGRQQAILPYPLQNALTRTMRGEAARQGKSDYLSLWAGTGVARARVMPAGELMRRLLAELRAASSLAVRSSPP